MSSRSAWPVPGRAATREWTPEELKLLSVIVYRPLTASAGAHGREEEMDRVPELEFLGRLGRWCYRLDLRLCFRHGSHPPLIPFCAAYLYNLTQKIDRFPLK